MVNPDDQRTMQTTKKYRTLNHAQSHLLILHSATSRSFSYLTQKAFRGIKLFFKRTTKKYVSSFLKYINSSSIIEDER